MRTGGGGKRAEMELESKKCRGPNTRPRTPVALDPLEKQSTVGRDKKNRDIEISLLTCKHQILTAKHSLINSHAWKLRQYTALQYFSIRAV